MTKKEKWKEKQRQKKLKKQKLAEERRKEQQLKKARSAVQNAEVALEEKKLRLSRSRRFEREIRLSKQKSSTEVSYSFQRATKEEVDKIDWSTLKIRGTSTSLEKRYLRLTRPPAPDTVRPKPILEQSLEMLLRKWSVDPNYKYVCEQMKSIRQDLTVQFIKDDFTVLVYETHARLALEVVRFRFICVAPF